MKILLINKFLYPKGGDAISTLETGKLLSKRGHEVIFWGMDHPENKDFPYKKYFVSYIDYNRRLGLFQQLKNSLKILYSLEAKNKISKLIKKWRPDIVHLNNFAHQISPSILNVFKKCKIPSVMTLCDYKLVCPSWYLMKGNVPCEGCKNKKYYRSIINRCHKNSLTKSTLVCLESYIHHIVLKSYRTIQYYISPSKFLKEKVNDMGFKKEIIYLPNFVNLDEFSPEYDFCENTICYFGRLSYEKGIFTLINAIKELDISLKIIGTGPLMESLKLKVESEEIKNVRFLGYKSGEELKNEIKKSMATVIPSEWYENNPRTVLEAFSLGRPVIGARIGGIPELVRDNETGYTFTAGNVEDLREKIVLLLRRKDKISEFGKNARKLIENEFNQDMHYNRLIDIYKKAILKSENKNLFS